MAPRLLPLLIAVLLFVILAKAIHGAFPALCRTARGGLLPTAMCFCFALLFLAGYVGFSTQMLLSVGAFDLPLRVQWPVARAVGVVQLPDGGYVVPLRVVGRVQIYDPEWRFQRGWQVPSFGRSFHVDVLLDGSIRVLNCRGEMSWFDVEGRRYSSRNLAQNAADEPLGALPFDRPVSLTKNLLLLLFASSAATWALTLFGGLGVFLIVKLARSL